MIQLSWLDRRASSHYCLSYIHVLMSSMLTSTFVNVVLGFRGSGDLDCGPATGMRSDYHATPLYPQKLALTSPTSGGRSVGIVRSRTKATDLLLLLLLLLYMESWWRTSATKLIRFAGFEVLTAVLNKEFLLQEYKPMYYVVINRLLPVSRWLLAWLIIRPWRRKRHFPPTNGCILMDYMALYLRRR
jgi:hypothetical protein